MSISIVKRDQGDTAPPLTMQLLVNGSPYDFTGASITAIVGGTVGSGVAATYMRYVLAGTWNSASLGMASIAFPLDPSAMAPSVYPCWVPARLELEVRAVDSGGGITQWPGDQAIPFIVRRRL
jgi:hypothetical protein